MSAGAQQTCAVRQRMCAGPRDFEALTRARRRPDEPSVEVWQAPVGAESAEYCARLLTAAERQRAERLPRAAGDRFTVARGLLRSLLGGRLGLAPAAVPLLARCPSCHARGHGPVRLHRAGVDWQLSVSHSHALCLVAIDYAGGPVGIDVEATDRREELGLLERLVLGEGRPRPADAPTGGLRWAEVLRVWTCAEAYAKASGVPLGTALEHIRATTGAGVTDTGAGSGAVGEEVPGPPGWFVRPCPVPPEYTAALATPAPAAQSYPERPARERRPHHGRAPGHGPAGRSTGAAA